MQTDHKLKIFSWVTTGMTFLLMFWGNLVSSTGSGLACPDWPLCHGTVTPPIRPDIIFEWGHRLLAFTTTLFIVITLVLCLKTPQFQNLGKRFGILLLGALTFQVLLGGLTVFLKLSVLVSTVHLFVATLIWSALIWLSVQISSRDPSAKPNLMIRSTGIALLLFFLVQILLGGWVRHSHAGLSCPSYPDCFDRFFPPAGFMMGWLAFAHRWWAIFVFIFYSIFILMVRKKALEGSSVYQKSYQIGLGAYILILIQIALGILTVATSLDTRIRAVHAGVGYGIWFLIFLIQVKIGSVPTLWHR